MDTLTTVFQVASLAGSVAILGLCGRIARRWPEYRLVVVGPSLWAGMGVVFYVLYLTGRLSPDAALVWSAVHRLLAVVLVLGITVIVGVIISMPPLPDERDDDDGIE